VAQGIGPEFKSQYYKKNKTKYMGLWPNVVSLRSQEATPMKGLAGNALSCEQGVKGLNPRAPKEERTSENKEPTKEQLDSNKLRPSQAPKQGEGSRVERHLSGHGFYCAPTDGS
jgi:hypothetical protein